MSYLLEALRKSERERQQQSPVPGLQTPTVEWESGDDNRTRSPWLLVAVVAIVLNTVLLAVLVWRFGFASDTGGQNPNAALPASTAPTTVATLPQSPPQSPPPAVIVVQQPAATTPAIVVRERQPDTAATSNTRTTDVTTTDATMRNNEALSSRPQAGVVSSEPSTVASPPVLTDAPLPTVHALPNAIRQQLPLLSMNSHIYASNARDSFVMINGVSLNPGDRISEGLQLIAVVPDGAVLEFQGQRFLLPALASFSP